MKLTPEVGLYVHWPYCERICPYCDFNVRRYRERDDVRRALGQAILADMRKHARLTGPRRLVSVFFGGGTPSLMDPATVGEIIATAKSLWTAAEDLEVSLEANPTAAEEDRFVAFAASGVTRLSLGVQSLVDAQLQRLGRNHDAAQAKRALASALRVFQRVSIDLIYALPGQDVAEWRAELAAAARLGSEHISPYQLTVEPGTALARAAKRGAFVPASSARAADLYEATQEVLGGYGFEAYEISNHARGMAARCRHNLLCWTGGDYVGVGPGAHGRLTLEGARWEFAAARDVGSYVRLAADAAATVQRRLDARETALERLIMGLRTSAGVHLTDLAPLGISASTLEELSQGGLVEIDGETLIVSQRGRLVLDRVVHELAAGPMAAGPGAV